MKKPAAGVLPVAIFDNELHMLIGRERVRHYYKAGGLWCGFGGVANSKETPDQCAAREWFEECRGLTFKGGDGCTINSTIQHIKENTCCTFVTETPDFEYTMYVVCVFWDDPGDVLRKFSDNGTKKRKCNEKDVIMWLPLNACVNYPHEFRPEFYRVVCSNLTNICLKAHRVIQQAKKYMTTTKRKDHARPETPLVREDGETADEGPNSGGRAVEGSQ